MPTTPMPTPPMPTPTQLDDQAKRKRSARARNSFIKRALLLLFAGAGCAMIVWALLPKPIAVDVGRVTRATLRITVEEDGKTRVQDGHRYLVSAPVLATFARSELAAGDAVTVDSIVARLLPLAPPLLDARTRAEANARVAAAMAGERQAHAIIARVRTSAELAEHELVRLSGLRDRGAASDASLERAQSEARALQQELASAQLAAKIADNELVLARAGAGLFGQAPSDSPLLLRAPIAGRVLRTFQTSEGVVQPGTPLVELGDPAALEITTLVLTSDAVGIAPGTRAFIEHWGGDSVLQAHVRAVEPSAVTRVSALGVEEQRVNVVLDLDSPRSEWAALGDGYRVEVTLVVWQDERRLLAPANALFRRDGGYALFRVEAGGARMTSVRVGRRNDESVEILEGVSEGVSVVMHPSERLTDGVRVTIR